MKSKSVNLNLFVIRNFTMSLNVSVLDKDNKERYGEYKSGAYISPFTNIRISWKDKGGAYYSETLMNQEIYKFILLLDTVLYQYKNNVNGKYYSEKVMPNGAKVLDAAGKEASIHYKFSLTEMTFGPCILKNFSDDNISGISDIPGVALIVQTRIDKRENRNIQVQNTGVFTFTFEELTCLQMMLKQTDFNNLILNAISNVRMYEMDEVLNNKRMQQPLQKKEKPIVKNVFMETNKPRDKEVVSNFINNQSNEDFFGINND